MSEQSEGSNKESAVLGEESSEEDLKNAEIRIFFVLIKTLLNHNINNKYNNK